MEESQRPDINASEAEVTGYVHTLSPYDAYLVGIERCDCKCYAAGWMSGYWRGMGVVLAAITVATIVFLVYYSTFIGN
jgi:hypothetical protein